MKKIVDKIIAVFIILAVILTLRSTIITDSRMSDAFAELFGTLPFSKVIAEVVCNFLKIKNNVLIISNATFIEDVVKLVVMSILQPVVIGLLMHFLLPLPRFSDSYAEEDYLERPGYKIKEMLLEIIAMPILAFFSAWIISNIEAYLLAKAGNIVTALTGIVTISGLSLISIGILIHMAQLEIGKAILWFFVSTIFLKAAETLMVSALCMAIYVAYIGGSSDTVYIAVLLALFILGMDVFTTFIQNVIVS